MITVKNLQKEYGNFKALRGLSFSIEQGQVVGILGPNGAGKTTLLKILTGFFEQSGGTATIAGFDTMLDFPKIKPLLGYLPETPPLYPELSVQDNILWVGRLRGMDETLLANRFQEVITATDLWDSLTKPVSQLSKGFKQRVGLAEALLPDPALLILDEPTNGLDPQQIGQMLALIKKLAGKTTILFSTHILSQIEECCDRALIIMNGELKADIMLKTATETDVIEMTLAAGEPAARIKDRLLSSAHFLDCAISQNSDGTSKLQLKSAPSLQTIFNKLSSGQL